MSELLVGIWKKDLETKSDWIQIDVADIAVIASCKHEQQQTLSAIHLLNAPKNEANKNSVQSSDNPGEPLSEETFTHFHLRATTTCSVLCQLTSLPLPVPWFLIQLVDVLIHWASLGTLLGSKFRHGNRSNCSEISIICK